MGYNSIIINRYKNEILEDICLYGYDKIIQVYFDKNTMFFIGYALEKSKIIYLDEISENFNLFELLAYLCGCELLGNFTPLGATIKACIYATGDDTKTFAEILNVPYKSLEKWVNGLCKPNKKIMENIAKISRVDYEIFTNANFKLDDFFYQNTSD